MFTRQELEQKNVHELRGIARDNNFRGPMVTALKKEHLIPMLLGEMSIEKAFNLSKGFSSAAEQTEQASTGKNGNGIANDNLSQVIAAAIAPFVTANIDEKQAESIARKVAEDVVLETLENMAPGTDENKVREIFAEEIQKVNLPQTIEIKNLVTGETKNVGLQHYLFPKLLILANLRQDTLLVGPTGSGKTHVVKAIAEALNLKFRFISVGPQTTKSDILGFIDATGNYHESAVYDAYKNGKILLFDEIDAANPAVLTIINAMLSNGLAEFPNGQVERHKNFVCFAAANTYGRGADRLYVGRNQLDAATLERFVVINFDYDENLELELSANKEFTRKIQKIRARVFDLKARITVSPRASFKGAMLLANGFSESEALEMLVFKGIEKDIKTKILGSL